MRRNLLLAALCGVVLVAGGAGAGYFLRPAPPPPSLQSATPAQGAPVTSQQFVDARKIQIRLETGADVTVAVNRAGVLTGTVCTPGVDIVSGAISARIDDVAVLALHLTVPPFRDLEMNAEGADVTALQTELNRLGVGTLEADGVFGWDTAVAVATLRDQQGMTRGRSLAREEIMWLPQESLSVAECGVALGSTVSAGSPFATAKGSLERIVLDSLPADLVDGERVVTAFGVTGPFDVATGTTSGEFLAELSRTEQARALVSQGPGVTAPATLQLAEAVSALQVPAAAVFGISEGFGCIQSGDEVHRVTVLGSTLGASLVGLELGGEGTKDSTAPREVNIGAAITHDSCR